MQILAVDDEELMIEYLERSLKLDRHVVEIAKDGREAIKKAQAGDYDVILLDVLLPLKNGLEVCETLRAKGNHTPIIFLTSRDDETTKIKGLDQGGDDYLTKPFSYRELEARIRAVTRRPHALEPLTISVGPLTLKPSQKIIYLGDQPLELRPKEYMLLEYLMRNKDIVISKEDLLQRVWSISATNASNRLEVCMYHIRNKVNKRQKLLKTVRGYGYSLSAQESSTRNAEASLQNV